MSYSCLSTECCEQEISCFKDFCDERTRVDSTIAAIAIVENDSIPKVGDVVNFTSGNVLLDECNYADKLLDWVREKQYECAGGGKQYHFFHAGFLAKGTRSKPTQNYSENGSPYFAKKHMNYEATSELMLEEYYLPNAHVFSEMAKRNSSLSVIYFFKQGALVLDDDESYQVSLGDFGAEVTGNQNDYIMGSFSLTEKGTREPKFYFAENPSNYIKKLKERTKFTFGENVLTGITEEACGNKGNCKAYTIAASTPFTIEVSVNELGSCAEFSLVQNCNEDLDGSIDIVVDEITGTIDSATGLPAGKYKFTQNVVNDCCIYGSQCFTINVK